MILVLLPGLHGNADLFAPLLAHMPVTLRRRVVEFPSDRIAGYETLVSCVEGSVMDEEEMVLVAESFSGTLALKFAAANPGRVRAVVLCVSFVKPPVPRILCILGAPFALCRFPLFGFLIRLFLAGRRGSRELVRDVRRAIRKVSPHVLAHRVMSAATIDGEKALRECTVPILCLAGSRDRLVGARAIRRIRRVRPDVPVIWLDAPHLLLQIKPGEAWREIEVFMAKVPALGAASG